MATYKNIYGTGLTLKNSLFQLNSGASGDTKDIGLFGSYVSSGTKYTGLFRDAAGTTGAAGDYVLFHSLATIPNVSTGVVSGSAVTTANLLANYLKAANGAAATPSITFGGASTTGLYYSATQLNVAVGGAQAGAVDATGFKAINGAAATPSISFINDPNTGLYSSAADTLAVATNGAIKFSIADTTAAMDAAVATTTFNATTVSSSAATGAVVVTGGLGVGGTVNIGTNLNITGDTVMTGNLTVNGTTTQVDSTTVNIHDNIINVNSGPTATKDAGYAMVRYVTDVITDTASESGTAQGGSPTTIILDLTRVGNVNDFYVGYWVEIVASGTGGPPAGETRQITAYVNASQTATVAAWSSGQPANDTTYNLYNKSSYAMTYGTASKQIQFLAMPNTAVSAPIAGTTSWADIHCDSVVLETGMGVPYGTAAAPSYSFTPDATLGMYGAASTIGFAVGGVSIATIGADGLFNKLGTAAAPSYSFTGRTDVGLYSSAANTLAVATNGAIKFSIGSTTASMDAAVTTTTFSASTVSSTTGTGAVVVTGGVGIGGQLTVYDFVGTNSMTPAPLAVKTISYTGSAYTVLSTDTVLQVDTSGGNVELTLENIGTLGATKGKRLTIVKCTTDTNTVTLTPASGESVLDGVANSQLVFDTAWQCTTLLSIKPPSGVNTWISG